MRKIYFITVMLLSVTGAAQQRTFTKSVSTNYATKQVTFNISWAAGSRGTSGTRTYNSKVWVLIDYLEIRSGVPYGSWQRATIDLSKLPANCTSDGTNNKGFWYQGQASSAQNANITITLVGVPEQFKWCAIVSDCPPQAVYNGSANLTFKGTAPFYVTYENESPTTITAKNYNSLDKNVVAMTDATSCPGCKMRNQNAGIGNCCTGLTLVNGYCRDLVADNAAKITCSSIEYEVKQTEFSSTWSPNNGCPSGWTWPSPALLKCMWSNGLLNNTGDYWSGQGGSTGCEICCSDNPSANSALVLCTVSSWPWCSSGAGKVAGLIHNYNTSGWKYLVRCTR